ncbi:hypothetical protein D9M71_699380 [compost metagenome]
MGLGAEDDAVVSLGLLQHFVAQGGAVLFQADEADVVVVERQAQVELAVGRVQCRHRRLHDLGADTVAGKNQNSHHTLLTIFIRAFYSGSRRFIDDVR